MPFISKDWRSPGETWVKTQEGWQNLKHLESSKFRLNSEEEITNPETAIQPHCHVTIRSTREIAGFNKLDEAVKKLDFRNAVRDVRRFNYVCALLDLLIGQQMIALSGCAQKVLLAMLEEVASYATANQHNPRGLRRLLNKLRALHAAKRSACWGGPLGSQLLWHQHTLTIERILSTAAKMQFGESSNETYPHILQLPEECIREIILRLSDHNDLLSSAQACEQMASIVEEQRVWRELTRFHFTNEQIELVTPKEGKIDWKTVYHSLKRTYGLKEEMQFAEMLALCQYCCCLFWRSLGHPCIAEQCPEYRERIEKTGKMLAPSPVPPSAFLKFFSL